MSSRRQHAASRCIATIVAAATVLLTAVDRVRAAEAVDLELILAVDVSGSIDDQEARLQRQGYVDAFRDAEVIAAITSGPVGRIAVSYLEWAGSGLTNLVADWALIDGRESGAAFSDRLAAQPVQTLLWTSISGAIDRAVPMFERNGFEGLRRVIDISGDGANNSGRLVTGARDSALAAGITVNGLPIINGRPGPMGWPPTPNLDLYYEDCVIGGPGAFLVVAEGFADFGSAVRRKLILEIAGRLPQGRQARRDARIWLAADRARPPCDIGERRLHNYMRLP